MVCSGEGLVQGQLKAEIRRESTESSLGTYSAGHLPLPKYDQHQARDKFVVFETRSGLLRVASENDPRQLEAPVLGLFLGLPDGSKRLIDEAHQSKMVWADDLEARLVLGAVSNSDVHCPMPAAAQI